MQVVNSDSTGQLKDGDPQAFYINNIEVSIKKIEEFKYQNYISRHKSNIT